MNEANNSFEGKDESLKTTTPNIDEALQAKEGPNNEISSNATPSAPKLKDYLAKAIPKLDLKKLEAFKKKIKKPWVQQVNNDFCVDVLGLNIEGQSAARINVLIKAIQEKAYGPKLKSKADSKLGAGSLAQIISFVKKSQPKSQPQPKGREEIWVENDVVIPKTPKIPGMAGGRREKLWDEPNEPEKGKNLQTMPLNKLNAGISNKLLLYLRKISEFKNSKDPIKIKAVKELEFGYNFILKLKVQVKSLTTEKAKRNRLIAINDTLDSYIKTHQLGIDSDQFPK